MININIYDNHKVLSKEELELIHNEVESLDFDWIKQDDNLDVYVNPQDARHNGRDIQIVVENEYGYFGWDTTHALMEHKLKENSED